MTSEHRIILCNDGGTLGLPDTEAPIGVDAFVAATLGPLRGTSINTLYWQLGTDPFYGAPTNRLSDWYSHRTQVGAVWGTGRDIFKTAGEWRVAENARDLTATGAHDAVATVIEHGHRAGLDVFVSMRINDGSDCRLPDGLDDVDMSTMRRQHPDWLLHGKGFVHSQVTVKQRDHSRYAYDFAISEVRAYTLALLEEAIEQYDLDGIDLDFCRQPSLFQADAAEAGASLLNAMLARVRGALDAKSSRIGRRLLLSVRVPPDIQENQRAGIDVAHWIDQGLTDIVVVGDPRGWHYRLPIEPYLALAKGRACQIVAQNLCGFREAPSRSASVLFGAGPAYSVEQYRAVAARHWQAGAHGQYIWNQHFIKYIVDADYHPQTWHDIGSPDKLARLDKHYLLGPVGRGGCLPITLATAGVSAHTIIEIADDFAVADPPRTVLRLMLEQLTRLDHVELRFNGIELERAQARQRLNYNDCWLDFDVSKIIRRGGNELEIRVMARNRRVAAPLVLRDVEVLVTYPS
ncbi:MAG: family 10 glycosylhydrolase [Janthinobacterium lividum]